MKQQGEILQSILHKHEEYEKYKSILFKRNQINLFKNTQPLNEETFEQLSKGKTVTKEEKEKL